MCARGAATRNLLDQSYEGARQAGYIDAACLWLPIDPPLQEFPCLSPWFLLATDARTDGSSRDGVLQREKRWGGGEKVRRYGLSQVPLHLVGSSPMTFEHSTGNFSTGKINRSSRSPRSLELKGSRRSWISLRVKQGWWISRRNSRINLAATQK